MAKMAFVTGISRGIGKAICERLVQEGFHVHGTYNTGEEEAKELKSRLDNVEIHKVDFSDRSQTIKLIETLSQVKFDALVNNAGMIDFESFVDFDLQIWDNTLEVNLTAVLLLVLNLSKNMPDGSAIINIASTDGYIGSYSSMSYAASKAALLNLTESLALNLGKRRIRVNAIAPGWIDTGMSTEESYDAVQLTPLGRNGRPEEIANVVNFIISNEASFMTGAAVVVDGGYTRVDYIMKKEADALESQD